MIVFLLGCLATTPGGSADEAQADSVRTLKLRDDDGRYAADLAQAGPVVVACTTDDGTVVYGPTEEPRIAVEWADGVLTITPDSDYATCSAWTFR